MSPARPRRPPGGEPPVVRHAARIDAPPGFSLTNTALCHGWVDCAPFAWEADHRTLWRADRDPDGAVSLWELREAGDGVDLTVHAPDGQPVESAVGRARRVLQLDRPGDRIAFHRAVVEQARRHPDRWGGLERLLAWGAGALLTAPDAFENAAKGVLGTNTRWAMAVRMIDALAALGPPLPAAIAERAPGAPRPKLARLFPTPGEVVAAGEAVIRERVRAGYRAPSLIRLAQVFVDDPGRLHPDGRDRWSLARRNREMPAALVALPGIGPATAAYLALLCGAPGFVAKDSMCRAHVRRRLGLDRDPTPAEMDARYEDFGPFAGLAYWMEWAIDNGWVRDPAEPRRG